MNTLKTTVYWIVMTLKRIDDEGGDFNIKNANIASMNLALEERRRQLELKQR